MGRALYLCATHANIEQMFRLELLDIVYIDVHVHGCGSQGNIHPAGMDA